MTDQDDVWRAIKGLTEKIEKLEEHYHQCHDSQFPSSQPKYMIHVDYDKHETTIYKDGKLHQKA
jgi:hypothetical protein